MLENIHSLYDSFLLKSMEMSMYNWSISMCSMESVTPSSLYALQYLVRWNKNHVVIKFCWLSNFKHQKLLAWKGFLSFSFSHNHFSSLWYYPHWLWNIIAFILVSSMTPVASLFNCLLNQTILHTLVKVYMGCLVTLHHDTVRQRWSTRALLHHGVRGYLKTNVTFGPQHAVHCDLSSNNGDSSLTPWYSVTMHPI